MYASKWKFKLLRNYKIQFLPISATRNEDVYKDMDRTFPKITWFEKHKTEISNIILNFIDINPALSYLQGMCFMTFTLFYVFRHSDFRDCETLFCLHKLVEAVRPIYPLDKDDKAPLKFIDSTARIILLNIHNECKELSKCLRELNIVELFVISSFPSFFGNWYDLEQSIILFDHLIEDSPTKILNNMIEFLTCFFLFHRDVILRCNYEQLMYILQQKGDLQKILILMKTKKFK